MKRLTRFALYAFVPLVAAASAGAQMTRERVAALIDTAGRVRSTDKAAARRQLDEAERALNGIDDPGLHARAQALECAWADTPAPAFRAAKLGLEAAARAKDDVLRATLILCRAQAWYGDGRADEAETDFLEAARLARSKGASALEADALQNSGYLRYLRGATADAIVDLQAAFRINVRLGRETERLDTLTMIANVYAEPTVAQYDRAIEYYETLLRDYEKLGRPADVADMHFNLGSTFQKKNDIPTALSHYRRAAALFEGAGKRSDAALTWRAIGTALVRAGRPAEALSWFENALRVQTSAGDVDETMATRQSRGAAYRKLHRPADAVRDLEAVLPYYEREKNNRFLERIYEDLAAAYGELNRWPDAAAAQEHRVDVQRQLFEAQRDEHAARLRVEFDTERRDEENRALARENALRASALQTAERAGRLQRIVIALTVLLAATLAVLFWRQVAQSRRMRIMALTDELTRLPNRRHVMAVAEESFAAAKSAGRAFSVIALDIDKFKRINDTFGHAAGDVVLRRVAHACRTALRPGDVIGRVGGEEFLVLLRNTPAQEAEAVAERLRTAVEATDFDDVESGLTVTISLGVASLATVDRFEHLTRAADELLYRAKGEGRNRVACAVA